MAIQYPKKLYKGQWRSCLAGLITREGIDAAPEDLGGLALVQGELLAHMDNEGGINDSGVNLLRKRLHFTHDAIGFAGLENHLSARRTELTRHCRDGRGLTLVGVRQVTGVSPIGAWLGLHGLFPRPNGARWSRYRDGVMEGRLRQALARLNPGLPQERDLPALAPGGRHGTGLVSGPCFSPSPRNWTMNQ